MEGLSLTLPLHQRLPACRSHQAPLCFRGSSTEGQLNGLQSSLNPAAFMPIASSAGQWPTALLWVGQQGRWHLTILSFAFVKNISLKEQIIQALKALADRYFANIFFFRMIQQPGVSELYFVLFFESAG